MKTVFRIININFCFILPLLLLSYHALCKMHIADADLTKEFKEQSNFQCVNLIMS